MKYLILPSPMREIKKFLLCLTFRFLCFVFTDTWFVPDEYFQCTEVAYKLVFNRGHLSWEWTRDTPLRSIIHPFMVSWLYRIYKFIGGDTNLIIRIIPNLLHSYFFALGDVFYIMLCKRIFFANRRGETLYILFIGHFMVHVLGYAITLLLYFTNWFIIYCSSRTMANCLECVLTIIALYWYPLYDDEAAPKTHVAHRRRRSFYPYMILGSLSIIIRPTAAIIWIVLGLYHLYRTRHKFAVIRDAVFGCLTPLIISIALDSNFEMPLKFPLWEFAKFNFFTGGSAHFGVHPWYWYFVDGLLFTSTGLYFLAIGGYILQLDKELPRSPPPILFTTAIVYILVHSWLPHKEHRFVLPIIPLILPFAGLLLSKMFTTFQKSIQGLLVAYVIINVAAAYFFCRIHQRGLLDATRDLIEDIDISQHRQRGQIYHISQLTPCYSMPQYAYFHQLPVRHHMLDCTPNLKGVKNYMDESEQFHKDPGYFLTQGDHLQRFLFHKNCYVVIYRKTFTVIKDVLYDTGFRVWRKYNHTVMPSSSNEDTVVFVLKRSSNV